MVFQRWLVADSGVMTGAGQAGSLQDRAGRRWDVALSFSGAQRAYVEQVAGTLKARGVRCFYDADEQVELWGRHLAEELSAVYAGQAAVVVVFISAEYAAGDWTRVERRAALGRAVRERREYVLPARFDDTVLPGLLDDVVAVDLRRLAPERFADLVAAKLASLAAASPGGLRVPAGPPSAGRLLAEVTDPFALEVHRPVQPEDLQPGLPELPELPAYVPREHDTELGRVTRVAAAAGRSGIAVLVGGSSTGKTRACWEALGLLRDQDPPWRLWHPIDPSRADAALAELPRIGPRTVVWLNEAQFYLAPAEAGLGERVAAGLRELLRDPDRTPVLVLATLWPQFWDVLAARPGGGDPHAQARELLAGRDITVPGAFTAAQVAGLAGAGDVRLALAGESAADGQVVQFLAGAPELLARYRNAPPAARAVIEAAMDARRLGMGAALPHGFLEAAAAGYLTDDEWDGLGEDWLEQALAYTAVPCKGARGPLTRIRPRPGPPPQGRGDRPGSPVGAAGGPEYRLADWLDQHGRGRRASLIPPAEFWAAVAGCAGPGDQAVLGDAAHARGLDRDAAQLYKNAAATGDPRAAAWLARPPGCLRADPRPAHWAAAHAPLDDPDGVARLLDALWAAGAHEQAAALGTRAAAHAPLDNPRGVAALLDRLRAAGAGEQAAALAARAAAHAPLDNPRGVAALLGSLREAAAGDQAAALAARDPAAHVALDNPRGVAALLDRLRAAGAGEQAAALAARAAAHAPLDNPRGVAALLGSLREAAAGDQAAALAARDPAAHVALDDPGGVAALLDRLRAAGAGEQAAALAARAAAHAPLDDSRGVAALLGSLREAGAGEQAAALAARAAAHAPLDDPPGVAVLLGSLREAAAEQQAALAARAAAHVALDDPGGVAALLDALWAAGADEQAAALAARLSAAGLFWLFLEQEGRVDQFRFGREPDGTPAAPWDWDDLDLPPAPQRRRSRGRARCGGRRGVR